MRILGFDPGKSTGYVDIDLPAITAGDPGIAVAASSVLPWDDRFQIYNLIDGRMYDTGLPDVIVVESFHLYAGFAKQQINNDFPSSQVIGIIHAYAHLLGVLDKVILQPASCISKVAIPQHLGSRIDRSEHARDAFKHVRYYIVTHPHGSVDINDLL